MNVPVPLYGEVPPLAVTDVDPLLPPLQLTFDTIEQVAINCDGSLTVIDCVAEHP